MDREQLEARKAALLVDNYVIVGHLREIDYWLARMEEAPSPPPDEPTVPSQEDA